MSRLLDKVKIIKLEDEIKQLKKKPMYDLRLEIKRLERANYKAGEQINTMNNLIGLLLKYIGKPIEIDKANLYTKQTGFEMCENYENNNVILRYLEGDK